MEHYWGAAAIMARLAIRSRHTLYRYIRQLSLPVFTRPRPGHPCCVTLYSNAALIGAWELARCQVYREGLRRGQPAPEPVRLHAQGHRASGGDAAASSDQS